MCSCSVTLQLPSDDDNRKYNEVVLVGCFHGSQSSAADVQRIIRERPTQTVALELCASRFADLRRTAEKNTNTAEEQLPWLTRWWNMIETTTQTRGLSSGLAAAVLGGFSGVQVALSGLEPGLEFTKAVESAEGVDIVLADQDVDETLHRIGQVAQVSLQLAQDFLQQGWSESYGPCASTLATALVGRPNNAPSVQLGSFLTRSVDAVRDVVRLTVPPFLLLQSIVFAADALMESILRPLRDASWYTPSTLATSDEKWGIWFAVNVLIVFAGYLVVALPAVKIVLQERDLCLADGIREACRQAGPDGRVVAVLGLLHVNGVAKLLEESSMEQARL